MSGLRRRLMLLIIIFIVGLLGSIGYAREGNDGDFRKKATELRQLIQEKKSESEDISKARILLRDAHKAMEDGRREDAVKLLEEGIALLKDIPEDIPPVSEEEEKFPEYAVGEFIFGLRIDPPNDREIKNAEKYFTFAKNLGMSYIKLAILWDYIEPEDDNWTWKGDAFLGKSMTNDNQFDYDYIAELSERYNISVIPMFLISKKKDRARDPSEWAEYIYAFITRYHKRMNIKFIEFQNEPNAGNDGTGGGRHWRGTAEDLARVNNAAYEKVKASYPDIMVGTAGFITGSRKMVEMYTSKFLDVFFSAKPKFDVFTLHDYPKNVSYTQGTKPGELSSQYHLMSTYREILDRYGYRDKPILITEGNEEKRDISFVEAATQYVASFTLTKANAGKNNVIGKLLSNDLMSSRTIALIDEIGKPTKQSNLLKGLIRLFKKYPLYSKHIAGELNSEGYWLEEFKNKDGQRMWVAFCPLLYETADEIKARDLEITWRSQKYSQKVTLDIGVLQSVAITDAITGKTDMKNVEKGKVSFDLGENPVFIEEHVMGKES